jgi:phosphatidylinositol alpha-1,6-mannosyltransferase
VIRRRQANDSLRPTAPQRRFQRFREPVVPGNAGAGGRPPPGALDHSVQLLSVGRLVARKRFDLVLEVLHQARRAGHDAGLWIAGEGPLRSELEERAAALGITSHLRFLGGVRDPDLAAYYRSADLFLSPCQSEETSGDVEGFGLTFIEAAACGLAAVALAEGGVVDAVADGESGLLTSREGFVASALELIGDPARCRRLGEQARRRAERSFEIDQVVRNLLPDGL